MVTLFRKIVSGNKLLYYLWFFLVRKRKGLDVHFFQRNTNAYVDGYPRSGNTFLIHLIKELFPEVNTVHHLHTVAPIKIALSRKLPVFILIRHPMECISSKYLMHFATRGQEVSTSIDERLLALFISDYLFYYQFVLKNKDKISIIHFKELINSPKDVLDKIRDRLSINRVFSNEDLLEAKGSYKGKRRNTLDSLMPNPKKENYKSVVKDHIIESKKYDELLELYESIIRNIQ